MSDFPNIQFPSSRTRTVSKPQLKHEFTSNKNQVRSKYTKAKRKWILSWDHLPIEDWKTLVDHYEENSGSSFNISGEMIFEDNSAVVIYSVDEITASSSGVVGHYKVEIQLEEL